MNHHGEVFGFALGPWVVALVLVAAGTTAWAESSSLPPDEQRRLEAGEVVLLDVLPPGASDAAQGGTAVGFVCASTAAVWDILVDWPHHPGIYPRVTHAEVTQTAPPRVRVRYRLAIWPFSFDVYMDKYPDAARRRVTWQLAEDQPSTFFAESSGYWQVDEAGPDSLVTYAVATRTLVPAFLTRGSQRDSLVTTLQSLRQRARKLAPHADASRPRCGSAR